MPGTNHFPRIRYNVERGLREIVARRHRLSPEQWGEILIEFEQRCAFCGSTANAKNRGIVADHLVPVVKYGELVPGNVVPACQTCNDSRGKKNWRKYLRSKFPQRAARAIEMIEAYKLRHNYKVRTPKAMLSKEQHQEYERLIEDFNAWYRRAKLLYSSVGK